MPNHCEQDLFITGPRDVRKQFLRAITIECPDGEPEIDILETQYPMPDRLKGVSTGGCWIDGVYVNAWRDIDGKSVAVSDEELQQNIYEYGAKDWYAWANMYWGTKWGDYDHAIPTLTNTSLQLHFCSAWSPISKGLIEVSKRWPSLTFNLHYFEGGAGYKGKLLVKNGVVLEEYDMDYRGFRGG